MLISDWLYIPYLVVVNKPNLVCVFMRVVCQHLQCCGDTEADSLTSETTDSLSLLSRRFESSSW